MVNVKKKDGFAALHLAALNGHYDVCRVLLEAVSFDHEIDKTYWKSLFSILFFFFFLKKKILKKN